jgi:hypothetical protein
MDMIDFIHNEPNYKELSDFTQKQGITTFDELIGKVPKLYEILEKVRNNREFDAIYKLLDQIKELQVSH